MTGHAGACEWKEPGSVRNRFLLSLSGPRSHPMSKSTFPRGGGRQGEEFGITRLQRALWPQLHLETVCGRDSGLSWGPAWGQLDPCRHALLARGPLASRTAGLRQETENQGARGTQPLWPAWWSSAYAVPEAASIHCLPPWPQPREFGLPLPSACHMTLEMPHSAQATAGSSQQLASPPHTPVPRRRLAGWTAWETPGPTEPMALPSWPPQTFPERHPRQPPGLPCPQLPRLLLSLSPGASQSSILRIVTHCHTSWTPPCTAPQTQHSEPQRHLRACSPASGLTAGSLSWIPGVLQAHCTRPTRAVTLSRLTSPRRGGRRAGSRPAPGWCTERSSVLSDQVYKPGIVAPVLQKTRSPR